MFLFNKRAKKIIKYVWIVVASFIALSMVIMYSGFSRLARTPKTKTVQIPEDVQRQLENNKENLSTSSKEQMVKDAIKNGTIKLDNESTTTIPTKKLQLKI
jgi:hypothetical protein